MVVIREVAHMYATGPQCAQVAEKIANQPSLMPPNCGRTEETYPNAVERWT
jgi:hypothetical protein